MVKILSVLKRRPDLSFEEFVEHWRTLHPTFVNQLPGLRRYVQNPVRPRADRKWPFDGISELWFEDTYSVKLAFEGPEADRMREDEKNFLGSVEWILADEHIIFE